MSGPRMEPDGPVKTPRPKPKAELSMYWHDFERWDDILKSMAESGIDVRSGNFHRLRFYYETMWTIWIEWERKIEDYDPGEKGIVKKLLDSIDIQINEFEANAASTNIYKLRIERPNALILDLRELHRKLLELKERLGLGVWSKRPPAEGDLVNREI